MYKVADKTNLGIGDNTELKMQCIEYFGKKGVIRLTSIKVGWKNQSFLVTVDQHQKYVLKLYQIGFLTDKEINTQLDICKNLRKEMISIIILKVTFMIFMVPEMAQ